MPDLSDLGRNVTYRVNLPGGQRRLKEASLYVMQKAAAFEFFGLVKLNKILWRADFEAFHERHIPVTGRQYQALPAGPAPFEMRPILNEMLRDGDIEIVETDVPSELRPIAKVSPVLTFFSPHDLRFLDEAVAHYKDMTGTKASHESHGLAWSTREVGDPIPYEASIYNDAITPENLPPKLAARFREIAIARQLHTL
jgi:hypothetical protein